MVALRIIFYGILAGIYFIAMVAFSSPGHQESPEPQPNTEYCGREAVKTKDGVKHAEKCHKMTPSSTHEKPSKVRE